MKKIISGAVSFWTNSMCFLKHIAILAKSIYRKRTTKTDYVDLAPLTNVADCEEHITALHWGLSNPRIKNIALTGPYGSGKSSVIQTFLERNPTIRDKSIQVSLATFFDNGKLTDLDVEEGVLKQLFYKVKQSCIPQSRYRKIHKVSYGRILFKTCLWTFFGGVATYVFRPSVLEYAYKSVVDAGKKVGFVSWLSLSVAAIILAIGLHTIARTIQLFAFRFSVKDVKLPKEIATVSGDQEGNEILNKKIDEIMYFFEETRFRIVFFEDLDRFNSAKIFIKLREINTLLNNYDAIKEPVVFVYALKDEVFTDTERTKFFDFIIPVIPVINSTNSGEIMLKLLDVKDGKSQKHDITQEYIFDVSPFISDMRVLYNIHNEFLLYKQTIKVNQGLTTLEDRIIMSLIIFKNLQPDQFAKLQNEEGLAKEAFNLKASFIKTRQDEIQEEIDKHTQILDSIDGDTLNSQNEIKYAMLCAITGFRGMAYSMRRNGYGVVYGSNVIEDDFDISELLQPGQWLVHYKDTNGTESQTTISNFHKVCKPYAERLEYLQYSSEEEKQCRRSEIVRLEVEIQALSTLSLQELINKYGSEKVFADFAHSNPSKQTESEKASIAGQIRGNDLLEFMLRKGYINEEYADYINFFKGNSMSVADMNFIMAIKTQTPKEFSYSLSPSKLPLVISKIQPHEFAERAALNFTLLEHMLSSENYNGKLAIIIRQLANESKDSWLFINEFVDKTKQRTRFVKMLSNEWPKLWDNIYSNHILTYERKLEYLSWLCLALSNDELCNMNANGMMAKFFVENEDILQKLSAALGDRVQEVIPALSISFVKLKVSNVPKTLLDCVFDECYYELNPDMIHSVVEYKNAELRPLLRKKNYTTVLEVGYKQLIDYVHRNFDLYVDSVVLQEENTDESAQTVLQMLDRCIGDIERCNRIIKHIDFTIDSIAEVCKIHIDENKEAVQAVCDLILDNGKLILSWSAVYEYWKIFGLTESLILFIETYADILAEEDARCLDDTFRESVIVSEIDNTVFKLILSKIRMETFTIGLDQISKQKLEIMVNERNFAFTVADYKEMDEYAPELCAQYISLNQQDFVELFDQIALTATVFESLVLDDSFSGSVKEKMLERDGVELMTEKVANYLCLADLQINRNVFDAVWGMLTTIRKQKDLLFRHLGVLELEDFEKYLLALEDPYARLDRKTYRHEELIPDNKENRDLVNRLQQVQYLTSFEYEMQIYYNPKREEPMIRCRIKAKPTLPTNRAKVAQ